MESSRARRRGNFTCLKKTSLTQQRERKWVRWRWKIGSFWRKTWRNNFYVTLRGRFLNKRQD